MIIDFDCPTCGSDEIVEVLEEVIMESTLEEIHQIDDDNIEIIYGNASTDGGSVSRYTCANCGDPITENGELINNNEDLFRWLKRNNMLKEDN